MEKASACHFAMTPWVATLATLVGNLTFQCNTLHVKPKRKKGHDSKGKRKPQTKNRTTEYHGQTTLEAKAVDFGSFRFIEEPQPCHLEF